MTPTPRRTARSAVGVLALSALVAGGLAWAPTAASAATAAAPGMTVTGAYTSSTPAGSAAAAGTATVSSDVLTTPQINGVVWSTAVVGTTAYAVGAFTTARPSGSADGQNTVTRNNAMAFDVRTGAILPWNPNLSAQGRSVEVSPDGATLYVGGDFSTVGGVAKSKIAAFTVSTGALKTSFSASISGSVWGIAPTATTVYVVGSFGTASSKARANAAAFTTATGALTAWNPGTDNITQAVVAAPDDSRVVIGGRFQTIGGQPIVGIGAVDGTTGTVQAFEAKPISKQQDKNRSWVTDMTLVDGVVYATGNGEGGHWFDGRFATRFDTGALVWLDNCYGASYGTAVIGQVAYAVSHSHDCTSVGAFGEQSPSIWKRATANTIAATGTDKGGPSAGSIYSGQATPTQLPWYPLVNAGGYTGQSQGGWSLGASSSTAKYLVMGGEFTQVNGKAQQGLATFATRDTAPNKVAPQYAPMKPAGLSLASGSVRVSFPTTWDYDDGSLTYNLFRDSGTTPIATQVADSRFWRLPTLGFVDAGLAAGSSHTYRVSVTDAAGNTFTGSRSDAVTVSSSAGDPYEKAVAADGATSLWTFGEPSGSAVYDHVGFSDAATTDAVQRGTAGPVSTTAASFQGQQGSTASANAPVDGPQTFTVESWFRTTSTSGGKIVGFGDRATGNSSNYDRHVYMDGAGRVSFGAYTGGTQSISSTPGLNDGKWHLATASLGSAGMSLSIDGVKVASRGDVTSAQAYKGFWRVGGDTIGGWPNAGGDWFTGDVADVAVYPTVLSAAQVDGHWVASGRTSSVPAPPADAYGKAVTTDEPSLYWRLDETGSTSTAVSTTATPAPGLITGGVTKGAAGALGSRGTGFGFDGQQGQVVQVQDAQAPSTYSTELWFSTTSTSGGKLIGYGDSAQGLSGNYDRHVYLQDDGRLVFGTWTGQANTITTDRAYNDGAWHQVVATQSSAGMVLYVDGVAVGTNPQTGAQGYNGRWHVGGDVTWGSSSSYVAGSIDEVSVYPTALTAAQVAAHHDAGTGVVTPPPAPANVAPTASATSTSVDLAASLDGSASSDTDGTVASWAWDFGDGQAGTGATAQHAYAAAGTYQVVLTVTDDDGATASTTVPVTVTAPVVVTPPVVTPPATTAYAADAFERQTTGGWGSADTGGAWTTANAVSSFSTAQGAGLIKMAAAGSGPQIYLNGVQATDAATRVTVALDKVPTGAGVYASVIGRGVTGQGDYRAKVTFRANGAVAVALFRQAADGTQTVLGTESVVPGLTYVAGQKIAVALEVTGTSPTTVRAKVWAAGGTEPTAWAKTATDSTAGLQAAGRVGFHSYLSASATNAPVVSSWDDLTITKAGN
ncbi:LamG-like jellyroll fold domain-containing protein [Frigoribacterium sp. VKM Ac-2530]|uniref:LamG-like jellyroll fold domain-containing protein n=1 Tax=Frigoribacterium sp. VKM Ac-2530 TaxID=2783822 RepID=UPI00188B6DC9|nr:LamG-like jellyroll fold domain-containing protein [Frigoribacterium sp. VKM Ac-2530]MBF4578194.1 PKD domain-containing protein [Frigoribacterium sp. VKM Ac-2530]